MSRIAEALKEYYGRRCLDYEPDCACCQAWLEYDKAATALRTLSKSMRK